MEKATGVTREPPILPASEAHLMEVNMILSPSSKAGWGEIELADEAAPM
jgi:hypothetical protein